jgi:two-component system, OmpR family, sensor histidine kinase CpxA
MNFFNKLNPANSLFGRIFLWFWFTTILLVSSSVWLARQMANDTELKPIRTQDSELLDQSAARLQTAINRIPADTDLEQVLMKFGRRAHLVMLLIDRGSKAFYYGMPIPMRPEQTSFLELIEQRTPYAIATASGLFFGPSPVQIQGKTYLLFVGKPEPMGAFNQLRKRHPGWLIGATFILSGALCFMLAWSLLRPIKQLQRAALQMSTGDFSARVDEASLRKDEIGQLGRDFNSMSEQVQTLMQGQKRLLADISHELRSPLARLQVAIGIAQQADEGGAQVSQRQLDRIEKEANQIEQMIAQVLKLSRLEARPNLEKEKVDLYNLLAQLCGDAQFEGQNMGKQVNLEAHAALFMQVDPQLIASAIENVLRNGLRYATHTVDVELKQDQDEIVILISDDGPGIDETQLKDIFSPFYRESLSRNRGSGGVGLGLAIAQQAIAAHDGHIDAQNRAPSGLLVKICLPVNHFSNKSGT